MPGNDGHPEVGATQAVTTKHNIVAQRVGSRSVILATATETFVVYAQGSAA